MAPAGKNTTPGRRKRTDNQYFDVGKVGRKTGITLKDTGIRDEHGLEPVSGIFSSPGSAQQNGSKATSSDAMDVQTSAFDSKIATREDILTDCAHRFRAGRSDNLESTKNTAVPTSTPIDSQAYKHWITPAHVFGQAISSRTTRR